MWLAPPNLAGVLACLAWLLAGLAWLNLAWLGFIGLGLALVAHWLGSFYHDSFNDFCQFLIIGLLAYWLSFPDRQACLAYWLAWLAYLAVLPWYLTHVLAIQTNAGLSQMPSWLASGADLAI